MKKILAFVLALAMVLGMATVAFAAPGSGAAYLKGSADYKALTALAVGDAVITKMPTVKLTFKAADTAYDEALAATTIGTITVDAVPGEFWVAADTDLKQDPSTEPTQYFAATVSVGPTVTDNMANAYTATAVTGTNLYTVENDDDITAVMAPSAYNVVATVEFDITDVAASTTDDEIALTWNVVATDKYVAPTYKYISLEVVEALYTAYLSNSTNVVVDLDAPSIVNETITAMDWNWLLNNYAGLAADLKGIVIATAFDADGNPVEFLDDATFTARGITAATYTADADEATTLGDADFAWWKTAQWQYLGMSYKFYNNANTVFTIASGDIDYTWTKAIDFRMDDGLRGYIKTGTTEYTAAEMYNVIRALTGDTKNPYTFGWTCAMKGAVTVPTMTVSYVIPQNWINNYGHKDLQLWIYANDATCDVCGATHQSGHMMDGQLTLDAATQTQRIEFKTSQFVRTLVLSKTAAAAEEVVDDNPNTGANDIVNVAVVFAVISLVAAGAFVFSKQR